MFTKKPGEFDIANSMSENLFTNTIEKKAASFNKLAQAADLLNAAAELFDDVGLSIEAEVATALLESIAKKKDKKKAKKSVKSTKSKTKSSKKPEKSSKKSDPAVKGLDSEKMVKNLKEKGWVFNNEDRNLADDINFSIDELLVDDMNCAHDTDMECAYCADINLMNDSIAEDNFSNDLNYDEDKTEMSPELRNALRALKQEEMGFEDEDDFEY